MPSAAARVAVYVTQSFDADAGRCIRAAASATRTGVIVLGEEPVRAIPQPLRGHIAAYEQVHDAFDSRAIRTALKKIGIGRAAILSLFSDDERAQMPLARVRADWKLPGLSPAVASNFRDKARMKRLWHAHGVPCANYRVVRTAAAARAAGSTLGFPLVIKPIDGMRSHETYKVETRAALTKRFERVRRASPRGVMLEQFVVGDECSCEVILNKGRLVWHSSTKYVPQPLTVVQRNGGHFAVVLPRERHDPDATRAAKIAARGVRALGLRTGISHVEWFRRPDGAVVLSEAAARVPSAAISTLSHLADGAHLIDIWVKLLLCGKVDAPSRRRFAAAAIFLRGSGHGRVRRIRGISSVLRTFAPAAVAVEYPRIGARIERDWDGNGCILLRGRATRDVLDAASCARRSIRVTGDR